MSVRVVHLVAKTHLDLGFTALAAEVEQQYLEDFFPRAIAVAAELREQGGPERLTWTTGSWILHRALHQPDPERAAAIDAAVSGLSPVIMTVRMPIRRSSAKRSRMPALMMSLRCSTTSRRPFSDTASGVPPARAISSVTTRRRSAGQPLGDVLGVRPEAGALVAHQDRRTCSGPVSIDRQLADVLGAVDVVGDVLDVHGGSPGSCSGRA